MSASGSVTASVEAALDLAAAFAVFTEEIGRWWLPGPINWYDAARAIEICSVALYCFAMFPTTFRSCESRAITV